MNWRVRVGGRRVLVDASAYFALFDQAEIHHPIAHAILERLNATGWRLFTTNFIIAETHALLLARRGRHLAAQALTDIEASSATVFVRVRAGDERRARAILHRYDDKDFSLTDATSFAVMERLHITRAFTFDHHFAQFGFQLIQSGFDA